MISIFYRLSSPNLRRWDGYAGVILLPGVKSSVDYVKQGHEKFGPSLDNSVEILHCRPTPVYTTSYGSMEVETDGFMYIHRLLKEDYGSGNTYYVINEGYTGVNCWDYTQSYSDISGNLSLRIVMHFDADGTILSDPYFGACLRGKSTCDAYTYQWGEQFYVGSVWGHHDLVDGRVTFIVDGNTTGKGVGYYFDTTPWHNFGGSHLTGTVASMSPKLALLRTQTYLAFHDPEPIGLRWELFSNIMDQLDTQVNSIANIKDIVDAVKTIKEYGPIGLIKSAKDLKSFSKTASNAWLSYRYSYSTTKMDLTEYKRAMKLLSECPTEVPLVFHAQHDGYNMTVRLIRHLPTALDKIIHGFRSLGLDLNSENLWDLIPFSFVVDWFVPLGDMFHDVDKQYYFDSHLYEIQSICFSRRYNGTSDIGNVSYYHRDVSVVPPQMLWYSEPASAKSVLRHFIDGVSLIISGRKE